LVVLTLRLYFFGVSNYSTNMLISFEIISFIALLAFFNFLMLSEVEGLDFTLSSLCDSMYLLIYDISSLNCIFLEGLISLYLPL